MYLSKKLIFLEDTQAIMNRSQLILKGKESAIVSDVVFELANISGLTTYDCKYVALAQDLDVPLVTSDRQIIKAFRDLTVSFTNFLDL